MMDPVDASPMGKWLNQFQNNLAHATHTMADTILTAGILKPAEMILREGLQVEYEAGANAGEINRGRGTSALPKLDKSEIALLQEALFSKDDEKRLNELQSDPDKLESGKAKYKEFSELKKEYHNDIDTNDDRSIYSALNNKRKAIEKDEDVKWYVEYTDLIRQQSGLQALFSLNTKLDIDRASRIFADKRFALNNIIDSLASKYNCYDKEIIIAFDAAQEKEKQIDTYLRKKLQKGAASEQKLYELRADILKHKKLPSMFLKSCGDSRSFF